MVFRSPSREELSILALLGQKFRKEGSKRVQHTFHWTFLYSDTSLLPRTPPRARSCSWPTCLSQETPLEVLSKLRSTYSNRKTILQRTRDLETAKNQVCWSHKTQGHRGDRRSGWSRTDLKSLRQPSSSDLLKKGCSLWVRAEALNIWFGLWEAVECTELSPRDGLSRRQSQVCPTEEQKEVENRKLRVTEPASGPRKLSSLSNGCQSSRKTGHCAVLLSVSGIGPLLIYPLNFSSIHLCIHTYS